MKKFIILLILTLAGNFHSFSQERTYEENIKFFLELNGTMGQYRQGVHELLNMLKEQYKDDKVPDEIWKEAEEKAQISLIQLTNDLVVVYKSFFSPEEIKELVQLYENKVAQKYIQNVMLISKASEEATLVWSKSLYNELTDYLFEKGFKQ